MTTLTKEHFDKVVGDFKDSNQKALNSLARDLKAFVKDQDDDLARLVNKGFEHTIKQLDVLERMARLEKVVYKIAEAINLKVA